MSILKYLQLQTIDPTDDGSVSPFDEFEHDETIDLETDVDGTSLDEGWNMMIDELNKDPDKLTFNDE